jgi:hypothetical protein
MEFLALRRGVGGHQILWLDFLCICAIGKMVNLGPLGRNILDLGDRTRRRLWVGLVPSALPIAEEDDASVVGRLVSTFVDPDRRPFIRGRIKRIDRTHISRAEDAVPRL